MTILGYGLLGLSAIGSLYLLAAAWAVSRVRHAARLPADGQADAPLLRHAEERSQSVSRSTRDRGASCETPASRAPQDDAVRDPRPSSDRGDVEEAAGGLWPSVTLLKPLHGTEPGLFDNLATFCRQDYPGDVEIVLGLQDPADPALPVADALRAAFPDHAIRIVLDARQHGQNRKVSNLLNMAEAETGDVIVLADSDMRVAPDYLRRLVAALDGEGVGGVTCLYHGVAAGNGWSRLAALGIDTHFLPGVVLGSALGLAKPCMGSTIALRRETLARIGGFAAVEDALADDYEIGAAIRRLGLGVVVPPFAIGHVSAEGSGRDLVAQELRWLRTIRQIDPAGHAGSVVTHPFAFALLGVALVPGAVAFLLLFTTIAARLVLCLAVERTFALRAHPYWLIPVRDGLSAALFVASFFGRGVSWRGYRYEVARSGALLPKARPDPT